MSYPTMEEYNQALQIPQYSFFDEELKNGSVKVNGLGLPLALCGGFALTYKITTEHNEYAIRCFHKESRNLEDRYSAIARKINSLKSSYFIRFEFQNPGIKTNKKNAPIVKMEWARGKTLGDFVYENYNDKVKIKNLRDSLYSLALFLENNSISHGDIQPGNLIVDETGSNIKLLDYDGMYVDEIANLGSSELGLRNFQHPLRTINKWNSKLDRFSFILLDLVFKLLDYNSNLWNETGSDSDFFLFKANDFADPDSSNIFKKIKTYSILESKIKHFISICKSDFDKIPSVSDFVNDIITVYTIVQKNKVSNSYISAFPVVDAQDYNECFKHVGEKVELIGKIYYIHRGYSVKNSPYCFINFSDWTNKCVKLAIWSEAIPKLDKLLHELKVGQYVSVSGLIDPPYTSYKFGYTHLSITISHPSQISIISKDTALFRRNTLHNKSINTPTNIKNDSQLLQDMFDNSKELSTDELITLLTSDSKPKKPYTSKNKEIVDNIKKLSSNSASSKTGFHLLTVSSPKATHNNSQIVKNINISNSRSNASVQNTQSLSKKESDHEGIGCLIFIILFILFISLR